MKLFQKSGLRAGMTPQALAIIAFASCQHRAFTHTNYRRDEESRLAIKDPSTLGFSGGGGSALTMAQQHATDVSSAHTTAKKAKFGKQAAGIACIAVEGVGLPGAPAIAAGFNKVNIGSGVTLAAADDDSNLAAAMSVKKTSGARTLRT